MLVPFAIIGAGAVAAPDVGNWKEDSFGADEDAMTGGGDALLLPLGLVVVVVLVVVPDPTLFSFDDSDDDDDERAVSPKKVSAKCSRTEATNDS